MIEETILSAIGTYGFPIVAFCMMYYMANTTIKENTKAIREITIALRVRK